jgi:hypothetical protein
MSLIITDRNKQKTYESLCKRIAGHLFREFGVTVSAGSSVIALYNWYLWNMIAKPLMKSTVKKSLETGQDIALAGKHSMENMTKKMLSYIVNNPVEIATCAVSMRAVSDTKLKNDLNEIVEIAGSHAVEMIAEQAHNLTQGVWEKIVQPRLLRYIPDATHSELLLLPTPIEVTSIDLVSQYDKQRALYPIHIELQDLRYTEKLVTQPSTGELLLKKSACSIMNTIGIGSTWKLADDCLHIEERETGLSSLQARCPRVYEDVKNIIGDQTEDFMHASANAITRGIRDVNIQIGRATEDTIFSAQVFGIFLTVFMLFYFLYRVIFGKCVDAFRGKRRSTRRGSPPSSPKSHSGPRRSARISVLKFGSHRSKKRRSKTPKRRSPQPARRRASRSHKRSKKHVRRRASPKRRSVRRRSQK